MPACFKAWFCLRLGCCPQHGDWSVTEVTTPIQRFFICGSALSGQPDHGNLGSARLVKPAQTLPLYRLHSVANGWHPGIYAVESGGISIPGEVYELTQEQFDHLISTEPPNMYLGELILEDGERIQAMLYPQALVEEYQWPDVSHYVGWTAYKQANPT